MTSHICITCPKPFEWVGGTQCICPSGTVPNADNTDCVECMSDENCQALKGNLHWVCDTDTNTCACMSGLHEVGGECECDNPKKTSDEDGNCSICQLSQAGCPTSDFTGTNDCKCCPAETPIWNGSQCISCAAANPKTPIWTGDTCRPYNTCKEAGLTSGYNLINTNHACGGVKDFSGGFNMWCTRDNSGPVTAHVSGYILAPSDGTYTFWFREEDKKYGTIRNAEIIIDGQLVHHTVDNNVVTGSTVPCGDNAICISVYLNRATCLYSI